MNILLTGGCGFIGSNLAKRCLEEGWNVISVDDLSSGYINFLPFNCTPLISDFSNEIVLNRIRDQYFDIVFHIAATPRVSYSVEQPLLTNDNNVTKTLKLLEACRGNIKRFIFASSSSVYGGASILPTKEETPKNPKSPYALQKSIIEDYLKLWFNLYEMDSACLRFFNVFGPNQLGNSPYATAVSAWLTAIKIGTSLRSDGDGTQSRDMCYVDNVVDACVKAAINKNKLKGDTFNVACGESVTNNEILKYLTTRYPNIKIQHAPFRQGDVMHSLADITKSKNILSYEPIVKFWEGLERTMKWVEQSDMI